MRLIVEAGVSQRRGGMAAVSRQIGLAGHGRDADEALAGLQRAVAAWVMGVTAAGRLTEALDACGIRCENPGSDDIAIDLRVI